MKLPDKIYENDNGLYIKTGLVNNITVVDIDEPNLEHNKKLIELINTTCPTLCEKTNKGLHFYFKYNIYIDSSVDTNLKIDILNDGKCAFCAGSYYYAGEKIIKYELLNDFKINDMNETIMEYLMILKCDSNNNKSN